MRAWCLKRKQQTKQQKTLIIVAATLAVALLCLVVWSFSSHKQVNPRTTPAHTPGDSVSDQPKDYTENPPTTSAPTAAPAGTPVAPAKPTLQKSSGNAPGSSVPVGAVVQFTCEGAPGLDCEIVLKDSANAARVITLTKQPITSNGRSQYFATWEWTTVQGSWVITSRVSNAGGGQATSDPQTLEVK